MWRIFGGFSAQQSFVEVATLFKWQNFPTRKINKNTQEGGSLVKGGFSQVVNSLLSNNKKDMKLEPFMHPIALSIKVGYNL
jgi:hypothetical protein